MSCRAVTAEVQCGSDADLPTSLLVNLPCRLMFGYFFTTPLSKIGDTPFGITILRATSKHSVGRYRHGFDGALGRHSYCCCRW